MTIARERYGIAFPFQNSDSGLFLKTTTTVAEETKTDLIHLILTRKGSRYFLPDFGTRLYEYIFEPMDSTTSQAIDSELRDVIKKYIPNIIVNEIKIQNLEDAREDDIANAASNHPSLASKDSTIDNNLDDRIYRVAGDGTEEYTAKIFIDYSIKDDIFGTRDFIIINL
jgi:phage baseplate assembly protein W|tara:strand:+ start:1499 stop:2005 length:507 start_codon:yes stop_codon:yes gene_type:complete